MAIYIFNPEHDYALANNDPHFMAPASAIKFATDCALFLRHIVPDDACIFIPHAEDDRFYSIAENQFGEKPSETLLLKPWGWDPLVMRQCEETFPDIACCKETVENVHRLAHRRNTIGAMKYLHHHCSTSMDFPEPARELFSTEEMGDYVREHQDVIFKSPYSGNGRGHLYARGHCSPTLLRQGAGVIRRQGSIMAEPLYEVVQDFAMEYHCQNGEVEFAGYSLFNTSHYGYAGNHLLTDNQIEDNLSQWTSRELLHDICDVLTQYIHQYIAPYYDGFLGVDMFIYRQDGQTHLNPMVEMNIRMTMGMAAHILTERFLHPASAGTMQLEYNPTEGGLLRRISEMPPLVTPDGRWRDGFLSLNPVNEKTQYAITVKIHKIN